MATFTLHSEIKIGNYKPFRSIKEVAIKRSLTNFMDTAKVVLPAVAVLKDKATGQSQKVDTARQFKRGDRISIALAYNNEPVQEWEGFIARVNKTVPCELECEGYAFQLRDKSITKVYQKTSLKQVLSDLIAGTDIVLHSDNEEVQLDRLELVKIPRIKALQTIVKELGEAVSIWFEGNVLYAGLKYARFSDKNKDWQPDVKYRMGWNCVRDGELKERDKGDDPYEVEFVAKQTDGQKKKASAGKANSNVHRKVINAVKDNATLQKMAKEREAAKNYTGVEGSITGFLIPKVKPGNKIAVQDDRWAELGGNYLVEEVTTVFGVQGARRKVKISVKL